MAGQVVRLAVTAADLEAAYRIRHVVFVDEQGVPVELERDDRDPTADHVLALANDVPVGCRSPRRSRTRASRDSRLTSARSGTWDASPCLSIGPGERPRRGPGPRHRATRRLPRAACGLPRRTDAGGPVLRAPGVRRLRRRVRRRRPPAPPHVARHWTLSIVRRKLRRHARNIFLTSAEPANVPDRATRVDPAGEPPSGAPARGCCATTGPVSRAELGDAVELSRSKLAVELDRLIEIGLVEAGGLAASRGGRRSGIVRLAPQPALPRHRHRRHLGRRRGHRRAS